MPDVFDRRELQSLENATVEICQPGVCDDIVTYSPDLLFEQLVCNAEIELSGFAFN